MTGLRVLPRSPLHRLRRRRPDSLSCPPTFAGRVLVSAPTHSLGGNKGMSEAGGSKGEWKGACEHCEAQHSQSFVAADIYICAYMYIYMLV